MIVDDVAAAVRRHAADGPDRVALRLVHHRRGETVLDELTYGEVDRIAAARADWLRRRNPPGAPVLVVQGHGRDLVLNVLACLYARAVVSVCPVPSGRAVESERLGRIVADSGARLLLTDDESAPRVLQDLGRLTTPLVVTTCREGDASFEPPPVDERDVAVLQYTSGSTSSPRGVAVHHGALLDNIRTLQVTYGGTPDDEYCGWLPLFHDMGLVGQFLCPLHTGGAATMLSPSDFIRRPARWLRLVDRFRAGYSAAPNFGLDLCVRTLRDADLAGLDLSCWKVLLDGAEPINPATVRAFVERLAVAGLRPDVVKASYGMAETTLFVSGTPLGARAATRWVDPEALHGHRLVDVPAGSGVELVSCGPAPALEILVVDPVTLVPQPDDAVGELWVRGASVASGYWNPPDTDDPFQGRTRDGAGPYLRTGDLGALSGGELFVTGRVKDLVVVNGRNVYPTDVEQLVAGLHPAVAHQTGAFFSLPVGRAGGPGGGREEAVLVQEIRPAALGGTGHAELCDLIKDAITRAFGIPVGTVVLVPPGTIPRTTSGKVRRSAAAEQVREGSGATLHEALSPELRARHRCAGPAPGVTPTPAPTPERKDSP